MTSLQLYSLEIAVLRFQMFTQAGFHTCHVLNSVALTNQLSPSSSRFCTSRLWHPAGLHQPKPVGLHQPTPTPHRLPAFTFASFKIYTISIIRTSLHTKQVLEHHQAASALTSRYSRAFNQPAFTPHSHSKKKTHRRASDSTGSQNRESKISLLRL